LEGGQFYAYAIHIIYGIILTKSFDISGNVFVPIGRFQLNESNWLLLVNSLAIILTQYILISGWVNYARSINKRPHRVDNKYGNARFVIDLIITFAVFYLVNITNKVGFVDNFWQAFVGVIPALFFLFVVWDYLKSKEYENIFNETEKVSETNQRYKTAYALGIAVVVLVGFLILRDYFLKTGQDILVLYLIFIILLFGINTWYRIIKNDITWLRPGGTTPAKIEN
jgi:Ca2+/Na+ antiporter